MALEGDRLEVATLDGWLVALDAALRRGHALLGELRHVLVVGELDSGGRGRPVAQHRELRMGREAAEVALVAVPLVHAGDGRPPASVVHVAPRAVDLGSGRGLLGVAAAKEDVGRVREAARPGRVVAPLATDVGYPHSRGVALFAAGLEVRVLADHRAWSHRLTESHGPEREQRDEGHRPQDEGDPQELPPRPKRRVVRAPPRRPPAHRTRHQYQTQVKTWMTRSPMSRPAAGTCSHSHFRSIPCRLYCASSSSFSV